MTQSQDANPGDNNANPAAGSNHSDPLPGGAVHQLPGDLTAALLADPPAAKLWRGLTVLGRNEFICWVEDAKQQATRQRRIGRTVAELHEGKRRPCCWPGCKHRERNGKA